MCGITGFYSKTDKGLSNHNLVSSANSFQHRGPDSEGYYIKTQNGDEKISNSYIDIQNTDALKVGIGFKRLSILDVENGSQPFSSQDGSCLLYTSPSPRDKTVSRMPSSA